MTIHRLKIITKQNKQKKQSNKKTTIHNTFMYQNTGLITNDIKISTINLWKTKNKNIIIQQNSTHQNNDEIKLGFSHKAKEKGQRNSLGEKEL